MTSLITRKHRAEAVVLAALLGGMLLLGSVMLTTYRSTSQLAPALAELDSAQRLVTVAERFHSAFLEAQSDRRAYLISGNPQYLVAYRAARARARADVLYLRSIIPPQSANVARAERLQATITAMDVVADSTIRLRASGGVEAAAAEVRSGTGQRLMTAVETDLSAIKSDVQDRLARSLARAATSAARAERVAIASASIAVLLIPVAAVIILSDLRYRRRQAARLAAAQVAAEAATRAKSEFLAGMSHEIRTPLNGVIGMTDLALGTALTPLQRDYLTTARVSAESLLRLLNDVLDFSKVEAGRLDLEAAPFLLRDLLGDTLRPLALQAQERGVNLAYRVVPSVPDRLIGDAGRLQQVIGNLVGNAIKFTSEGEIVVLAERDRDAPREGPLQLHFSIRDTGVGIPIDRLDAIFEHFTQADASTTRQFGGTGLGLAICERLVRLMGGRIWVESTVGLGSTFHFTAKLEAGADPTEAHPTVATVEGLRVLVAAASATNRLILEEMVAAWRMVPVGVSTLDAAADCAERDHGSGATFAAAIIDESLLAEGSAATDRRLTTAGLDPARRVLLRADARGAIAGGGATPSAGAIVAMPPKPSDILDALMTIVNAAGQRALEDAQDTAGAAVTADWAGRRVLVVEDNVVNQRVARGFLERLGIEATIAANGREGLAQLALDAPGTARAFDLVLMDVEMPEMDGLEATRRIRAHEREHGGRLPVIAVTAHALRADATRCFEAGMDECLTKPVRFPALIEMLARFLPPHDTAEPEADGDDASHAEMLAMAGDDAELLVIIAHEYLRQAPQVLAQLRQALGAGDVRGMQQAAHKLKGSAAQFAAREVASAAAAVEAAPATDGPDIAALMQELERTEARLQRQLARVVAAGTPAP